VPRIYSVSSRTTALTCHLLRSGSPYTDPGTGQESLGGEYLWCLLKITQSEEAVSNPPTGDLGPKNRRHCTYVPVEVELHLEEDDDTDRPNRAK
jgi:hypothetical protein